MKYRPLGKTGIKVSEIGFGAWGVGANQWLGGNDEDSLAALKRAVELGVNFIDTALAYGEGHSEKLVGRVVRDAATQVYVATKIPPKNRIWPAKPGIPIDEVYPYDYSVECTNKSLKHLGVDVIDLQQFHVWNPEWIARDEWRRAIEDLKKAGKVRYFGISINDHQPDSALEIVKTGLIDTVQVIYNVFDQAPEKNLFPVCQEKEVGVLARVPLDEGALAGAVTPETEFDPNDFRAWYFRGDRKKEVFEKVEALKKDLAGGQDTLAEFALRFTITHPAVSTVIPGMRKVRNVESSTGVSAKGALDERLLAVARKHAWDKNYYQ
jgi:aryl-alcohol dehydrogenase-like predicted oxidoreductase